MASTEAHVGTRATPVAVDATRMDDEMLADQRRLVELVKAEGWEVTDVELTAYESPWSDENDPEASVTISARKPYEGDGSGDDTGGGGDDEDNPFRVK